ncbi:WD40-repeat-containing domain protein [Polychytrium aggregatum]|uniref:WD40-repeat-containing domain protein n=1 Tax=Polychytrium aggregatum TaxID=110093 RepID=UPI0022FE8238|nr:WD40-repeat-containing domain protein [Polychytrium aggregatum]KAI9208663.1 WD40-repeat-containing domain protein [Polychytrium aggregatum]
MHSNLQITSDDVNYLIYRYLLESGFVHSRFAFEIESAIHKSDIKGSEVKSGALIEILQKGMRYCEVEAHTNLDGTEKKCMAPFNLLGVHKCDLAADDLEERDERSAKRQKKLQSDDISQSSKRDRKEEKRIQKLEKERKSKKEPSSASQPDSHSLKSSQSVDRLPDKSDVDMLDAAGGPDQPDSPKHRPANPEPSSKSENSASLDRAADTADETGSVGESTFKTGADADASETVSKADAGDTAMITLDEITVLKGHASEVFACSWNPVEKLLATGSGDSTARIWTIPDSPSSINTCITLLHETTVASADGSDNKDVTALEWNPAGTHLATGTYDGLTRIWTKEGVLVHTMHRHNGPVFALKWNKSGDLLLSGSVDKTAVISDARTGEQRQQFEFHSAPTLDVDWKDDTTFATCSSDQQIFVCQLGSLEPLKQFSGHSGEVNAVKWDPMGQHLASCSDDCTAKIWSLDSDVALATLEGHDKEIYSITWCPVVTEKRKLLATSSFDATARVWDAISGTCVFLLERHVEAIYSVSFSPDGEYLASGSFDNNMNIWSMKDGSLLRTFTGNGGIFEVNWNPHGDQLAACFSNNNVIIAYLPDCRDKSKDAHKKKAIGNAA